MNQVTIVVPCFNEVDRLRTADVELLAAGGRVVLVNDGSTDGTLDLMRLIEQRVDRVEVLDLQPHGGKAEAVRQGMLIAVERGDTLIGFADADMATPAHEVLRLQQIGLDHPEIKVVLGSRVKMLGRRIERSAFRHYTGRVYATAAGTIVGLPVYDTQCGAKFFRNDPVLRHALSAPFHSRWSFDVELIGRLIRGGSDVGRYSVDHFIEVPLEEWYHVPGSKLRLAGSVKAGLELILIARALGKWGA